MASPSTTAVRRPRNGPRRSGRSPSRHPGRWVAAAIVLLLLAIIVHSVATNPRFGWGIVRRLLLRPAHPARPARDARADGHLDGDRDRPRRPARGDAAVAQPARRRLELDLHLALPRHARAGPDPVLELHLGALSDRSRSGSRSAGRSSSTASANAVITPFAAAILGLGLNEGAYMAEIVRAGIISVDEGQTEAAHAAGHDPAADHAPDRAAAGDAGDHPADRQRDDLHAEDDVAGQRDRLRRAAVLGAADLLGELPPDPAAARRERLVPDHDHGALDRAVLPRAPVRPRRRPRPAPRHRCSACAAPCSRRRGSRGERRADGQGRGRPQVLRARSRSSRASRWRSARARCSACSARPAPASRRSCAASTTWRRSTPGGCRSTASWSATGRRATGCYELQDAEVAASARTSGWCSSASTCSRT